MTIEHSNLENNEDSSELKNKLDLNVRTLVNSLQAYMGGSLDFGKEYDVDELRQEIKKPLEDVLLAASQMNDQDAERLRSFCETVEQVPSEPDGDYLTLIFEEFNKIKDLLLEA